jgi:hypothetical protein
MNSIFLNKNSNFIYLKQIIKNFNNQEFKNQKEFY